jgi:hypothetical protein
LVAAFPSVRNVQVVGDLVEGKTIRGIGTYFGGKEGRSKFEWLREDKDSGYALIKLLINCKYVLFFIDSTDVLCSRELGMNYKQM